MHSSHLASILGVVEHTKNLIGTRLLPASEVLQARVQPTSVTLDFAQAVAGGFQPIAEEAIWGRNMDEAWFHLTGTVPGSWAGAAVVAWVDLGTEALAYDRQGTVLNSLNSGGAFDGTSWKNARPFIPLLTRCAGGEAVELYLNATCFAHPGAVDNSGPVPGTMAPAGMPLGRVSRVRVARFDQEAWNLYYDVEVLANLQGVLPANSARRAKIVAALRACCEAFIRSGDLQACRELLRPVLAARANASALTAVAVGHGHLDTAWLWPLTTSRKKFARTTANQLHLIEQFPGYVFGASSAAHLCRAGLPGAVGRVAGAAVPVRVALLRRDLRASPELRLAARHLRLRLGTAADPAALRLRHADHHQDRLEQLQPPPPPQLPLARHRRQRGGRAFPAGRLLREQPAA